jgi:hypothetical protein
MSTAGGLAFMAAIIASVVSTVLSTVLPDIEPTAYGNRLPVMAKLADAARSGLVSLVGKIVAEQLNRITLDPVALASAPNIGVLVVIANEVEPIPSMDAVRSGLLVVIAHDAEPVPLLIS